MPRLPGPCSSSRARSAPHPAVRPVRSPRPRPPGSARRRGRPAGCMADARHREFGLPAGPASSAAKPCPRQMARGAGGCASPGPAGGPRNAPGRSRSAPQSRRKPPRSWPRVGATGSRVAVDTSPAPWRSAAAGSTGRRGAPGEPAREPASRAGSGPHPRGGELPAGAGRRGRGCAGRDFVVRQGAARPIGASSAEFLLVRPRGCGQPSQPRHAGLADRQPQRHQRGDHEPRRRDEPRVHPPRGGRLRALASTLNVGAGPDRNGLPRPAAGKWSEGPAWLRLPTPLARWSATLVTGV